MTSEKSSYHPTIWRTCRALKNVNRLACLRTVLERPGLTVGEIAQQTQLPLNQASINLRLLQSRGLIASERKSRWTRYVPEADPLVAHAEMLLNALAAEFLKCNEDISGIVSKLWAFTHDRRLTILSVLSRSAQPMEPDMLVASTRISLPAVWRHLRVLETAGVIHDVDSGWQLLPERSRSPLVRTVLRIL